MGIKSCHCYYPDRATFDILLKFSIHSKRADMEKVFCAVYRTNVVVIIHYLPLPCDPQSGVLFCYLSKGLFHIRAFLCLLSVYLRYHT